MKLFNLDHSPYCARVRYLIKAKGIPVDIVTADVKSPEFKLINPLGKVPALETLCGRNIFESDPICEYLEQLYPGPIFRSFLPADPYFRAKTRALSRITDLYLQPEYTEVLYSRAASPERLAAAIKVFDKEFDVIEVMLGEVVSVPNSYDPPTSGPFICGQKPTLGDVSFATSFVLAAIFFPKVKYDPFKGRPRLQAWWAAMLKDHEFAVIKKEMESSLEAARAKARQEKSKL